MATVVGVILFAAFVGWVVRKAMMLLVPSTRIVTLGHGTYREGNVRAVVASPWPHRLGWAATFAVLLLFSPILYGWVRDAAKPNLTANERQALARTRQATDHAVERLGEGVARRIERNGDEFVNPPPPPAEYNPSTAPEPSRRHTRRERNLPSRHCDRLTPAFRARFGGRHGCPTS
jgi:hypothetical protein